MFNLYLLMMVAAGIGVGAQVAVNSQLAVVVGAPLWAANINFAVSMVLGAAALGVATLAGLPGVPMSALMAAPRWVWLGGVFGSIYVLTATMLAHRLGAALLTASGILGQVTATLLIDHYGWLGMPVSRLSWTRVVGAAMVLSGVVLIRWK